MSQPSPPKQIQTPTQTRFVVLGYLCAMAFILYLDRVCMAKAVVPIGEELKLSKGQMGWVLSAFTLAYGLFEIPTGRWGDRFGSRRVLTRIALWWSAFTMLTAASPSVAKYLFRAAQSEAVTQFAERLGFMLTLTGFHLVTLVAIRFLFGAGEAGAFPNTARIIAQWFPLPERGRVQGAILAAALIGSTLSPVLAGYLIHYYGWRFAFVIFGMVGVVWAILFHRWFRDDPREHPGVNDAERQLILSSGTAPQSHHEPIPWGSVFANRSVWLLGAIVTCGSFNSYLYFSWYATYLEKGREVSSLETGWLAGLALAGATAGQFGGGFVIDWLLIRSADSVTARRQLGFISYAGAAVLLVASVNSPSAVLSASLAAASCFMMFLQQSSWWSTAIEVSGKHVGSLVGLMNGLGVVGAMTSQIFFGQFADWREKLGYTGRAQWDPAFYVVAGILAAGAVGWLFVDPKRKVNGE